MPLLSEIISWGFNLIKCVRNMLYVCKHPVMHEIAMLFNGKGDETLFRAGLTGGIACGKSTVAQMLTAKGALLLDVDQLAKEVVEPKKPAWKEIVSWLGEDVLTADSSLNRQSPV